MAVMAILDTDQMLSIAVWDVKNCDFTELVGVQQFALGVQNGGGPELMGVRQFALRN
jgi:hypothetical protein